MNKKFLKNLNKKIFEFLIDLCEEAYADLQKKEKFKPEEAMIIISPYLNMINGIARRDSFSIQSKTNVIKRLVKEAEGYMNRLSQIRG